MSHAVQIISHFITAPVVVHKEVADSLIFFKITVVHHKRNAHIVPEHLIIAFTESDQYQPLHIPHRCIPDNIITLCRGFHHHKIAGVLNFVGQRIERRGNKRILQHPAFILRVVIDRHADDSGIILCQKNGCHAWNIAALFQQFLHPLHGLL